jgi:hypothetical protein
VRLPRNAGFTTVKLDAGMASSRLIVPAGVAARIRASGGLTSNQIDTDHFPRTGNAYQSPDYDTAQNKVDVDLSSGLGSVQVRVE